MLKHRVITAVILIPLVLGAVFLLPSQWFAIVLLLFGCLGAWEWSVMSGLQDTGSKILYVITLIAMIITVMVINDSNLISALLAVALIWWLSAIVLTLRYKQTEGGHYGRVSRAVMGAIILVPAVFSVYLLHTRPMGQVFVTFLLFLIWIADSGAYFAGTRFGKHKLCPEVSPGKTWEGVSGAVMACLLYSLIFSLVFDMQAIEIMVFLALSIMTVMISVFGDLMVSLVKREAKMKDSGKLLPGHGGIMDRIDSLTAAAPVFVTGILIMEHIQW